MFAKGADKKFKRHAIGIIILGCLAMYFSCCLASDALNIIQPAFTEKMGWSYSSVSLPFTIANYILIILSFWFSTYILRNGTRIFSVASFTVMAVGTALIGIDYSLGSNSYWLFLIGGILTKFSAQMVQMVCFQLCANWFESTRGRILGIITIAAPLNSATSITLLTIGKANIGLTACYLIITGILVIGIILAVFFGVSKPEDLGLTVDGVKKADQHADKPVEKGPYQTKWKISQLLKTKETWLLIIAFGCFNGAIGPIMGFFMVRMSEVGVNTAMALTIISTSSLLGIILSYIFGVIDDKCGTLFATRILGCTFVVACLIFYFADADKTPLIWIAAIMMASIVGGTPNLHPSSIIHVFGAQEYQSANRVIAIGVGVLSSFGVQLMSLLLDQTGSLSTGYMVFAILTAIATVCVFLINHRYPDGPESKVEDKE